MGAIFLGFIILILAVFCAATARRVVVNLSFNGGGISLRLIFIWLAAVILYCIISLVPTLLTFDGTCDGLPSGPGDCDLSDFLLQSLELSIVFSLLIFGLFFGTSHHQCG